MTEFKLIDSERLGDYVTIRDKTLQSALKRLAKFYKGVSFELVDSWAVLSENHIMAKEK